MEADVMDVCPPDRPPRASHGTHVVGEGEREGGGLPGSECSNKTAAFSLLPPAPSGFFFLYVEGHEERPRVTRDRSWVTAGLLMTAHTALPEQGDGSLPLPLSHRIRLSTFSLRLLQRHFLLCCIRPMH